MGGPPKVERSIFTEPGGELWIWFSKKRYVDWLMWQGVDRWLARWEWEEIRKIVPWERLRVHKTRLELYIRVQ